MYGIPPQSIAICIIMFNCVAKQYSKLEMYFPPNLQVTQLLILDTIILNKNTSHQIRPWGASYNKPVMSLNPLAHTL